MCRGGGAQRALRRSARRATRPGTIPALVGAEAGAAIVAQRGIEQVLVVEPVAQAGEERLDRPLRPTAAGPRVAGPAEIESPHVLVREVVSACLEPVHVVVFVRDTAHQLECVPVR